MENVRNSIHYLQVLNDCSPRIFKTIISDEEKIVKILLEIVINISELKIPLSPQQSRDLKNSCVTFILNVYKYEHSPKDLKKLFLKNPEALKYMIDIFLKAYKSYA